MRYQIFGLGDPVFLICSEQKLLDEFDGTLIYYQVDDWNDELSPWPAGPVFKNQAFGGNGQDTLKQLLNIVDDLPFEVNHIYMAGYSLAGLFSLWSAYQDPRITRAASCSGSLWYPGWLDYISKQNHLEKVYLSLGDLEANTRNITSTVKDCTLKCKEHYSNSCDCFFEWNEGNHFRDADKRLLKGINYLINK